MIFFGYFERRFNYRVQVLRTDGGGEYANIDLFCERTGIAHQRTETDNPALNGKAGRMHRTVLNMARCMIFSCRLPIHFWGDAVQYAAFVLNRSPCKASPKRMSPLEMLEGKPPNLANVVTFGSPCMIYRKPDKNSFWKRSQRDLILGVFEEVKGFRVYLWNNKKVINTQHMKYNETLTCAQNSSLLSPVDDRADVIAGTGTSPMSRSTGSLPVGGDLEPSTSATKPARMATRTTNQRKLSRRARDIMAAYIKELEDVEDDQDDALCNVVVCGSTKIECLDPPHYAAATKTPQAE